MLALCLPCKHNVGMNKLSTAERVQVIAALVEGNSINSTVRMTGISKPTILKLDCRLPERSAVSSTMIALSGSSPSGSSCDEIWAFCYCKKANVPEGLEGVFGFGDVWTWTGLDPDSKLMCDWMIGVRDSGAAYDFMRTLAPRFDGRLQITTDGSHAYKNAIGTPLRRGDTIGLCQCVKLYENEPGPRNIAPGKYFPWSMHWR